nr:hypothetical protein Itr_chr10CG12130 [Ipomoea trifida]
MLSTTNGNLPLSRTLPNPQPETTASEANPQPESTVSEANLVEDQDHIERSTKNQRPCNPTSVASQMGMRWKGLNSKTAKPIVENL